MRPLCYFNETQCTLEAFAEKGTHALRLVEMVSITGASYPSTDHPSHHNLPVREILHTPPQNVGDLLEEKYGDTVYFGCQRHRKDKIYI